MEKREYSIGNWGSIPPGTCWEAVRTTAQISPTRRWGAVVQSPTCHWERAVPPRVGRKSTHSQVCMDDAWETSQIEKREIQVWDGKLSVGQELSPVAVGPGRYSLGHHQHLYSDCLWLAQSDPWSWGPHEDSHEFKDSWIAEFSSSTAWPASTLPRNSVQALIFSSVKYNYKSDMWDCCDHKLEMWNSIQWRIII